MHVWKSIQNGTPKGFQIWSEYAEALYEEVIRYYSYLEIPSEREEVGLEPPERPEALAKLWAYENLGPPWAGGTYDQPYYLLTEIIICLRARRHVESIIEMNRKADEETAAQAAPQQG